MNLFRRIEVIARDHMSEGYTPRWLVFLLDQFIMLVSFLLMAFLREALFHDRGFGQMFAFRLIVVMGTSVFYSILFGTYTGVVRYSGVWDLCRLALSNVAILLTLIGVNSVFWVLDSPLPYNYFLVSTMVGLAFCFMFGLRMAVKMMFGIWMNMDNKEKQERVFVLGCDSESLLLTSALRNEPNQHYVPVAVIDITGREQSKEILGIPILPAAELTGLLECYGCRTVVVLPKHLDRIKDTLADTLIESGIRVMMVNRFEEMAEAKPGMSSLVRRIRIEDLLGREPIEMEDSEMRRSLRGSVILVTGAAGSIGSEISRQAAACSPKLLLLLDQAETPMHNLQLELERRFPEVRFVPIIADVTRQRRMKQIFEKYRPEQVYHAAAYKHVPMMENNPVEAVSVNVGGTRIVADLSIEFGAARFVMISTDKAVNPTNVMGASKRIAEIYVQSLFYCQGSRESHTKFITTRFGNVLGSNGSVVPLFKQQIEEGGPVTITHRDIIRYFMTIPEACNLVLEAGFLGNGGEIFVFDMGKPVRIYDLARKMIKMSGLVPDVDIRITETGLRPGEKLYEELLSDKEKDLPTPHEKIRIAQVRKYDYAEVLEGVLMLLNIVRSGDAFGMVRQMKVLVPEFISLNSVFSGLDALPEEKK